MFTVVRTAIALFFICVHGGSRTVLSDFHLYFDERVHSITGRSASHLRRKLHAL
jgi:hypothetical protein